MSATSTTLSQLQIKERLLLNQLQATKRDIKNVLGQDIGTRLKIGQNWQIRKNNTTVSFGCGEVRVNKKKISNFLAIENALKRVYKGPWNGYKKFHERAHNTRLISAGLIYSSQVIDDWQYVIGAINRRTRLYSFPIKKFKVSLQYCNDLSQKIYNYLNYKA